MDCDNPVVHVKFFCPWNNWTWYITEGSEQEDGDWLLYGKTFSNFCPDGELGYSSLNEIASITGPMGLKIERDMYWNPKPLNECR